ncbi:MAG: Rossmann-like and DUF2520 domain-containing protein [Bacillota bacterium]
MNKVGIIGLGRAGRVLAYLLTERGYQVSTVLAKPSKQETISLNGHLVKISSLAQLVQEAEILFITTPDELIHHMAQQSAELEPNSIRAALHLSGSLAARTLQPLKEKGILIGSLHPLQSLAQLEQALINLPGSTFTFEGDAELLPWVTSFVQSLGCQLAVATAALDRKLYHAGASVVSNFLVTLVQAGAECLTKAGFPPAKAQQALVPLVQGTLNNLKQLPSAKALTGPIARGDAMTIENHLGGLTKLPELLPAYLALAKLTATLAMEAGTLERIAYYKIIKILEGGGLENGKTDDQ